MSTIISFTGGKELEYELWTNPSPLANFAAQTITLSDNAENYKKLRIYYRVWTSADRPFYADFEIDTYAFSDADTGHYALSYYDNQYNRCRFCYHQNSDTTKLIWTDNTRIGGTGTKNENLVPLKICGVIKKINEVI